MRSKLVQGTKSITCEKRVRPEYMTVPRLKSQNRVRNYRQNPKPCSSRHQKKHPRNPYIAALFYKITLAEPDSTDELSGFPGLRLALRNVVDIIYYQAGRGVLSTRGGSGR